MPNAIWTNLSQTKTVVANQQKQPLEISFHRAIDEIGAQDWNSLAGTADPFMRYEFLAALEENNCVGPDYGWLPYHIAVRDTDQQLVAACPIYIKTNSYGEFVFDWNWASAYEQAKLQYYPKMVCSVPYNPATGMRILSQDPALKTLVIQQTIAIAKKMQMSGMHWLFTTTEDTTLCEQQGLMLRMGCQYHWFNHDYESFHDFTAGFVSRKRKKVNRERRMVAEQGIEIKVIHGNEASAEQIIRAHEFYVSTFDRKSGVPTLQLEFFQQICRTMGQQVVFFFAYSQQQVIACAICLRSDDTLYGRFWGCDEQYHSLHFETCFYQGIDYCIEHQLQRFEPGAQGEHKIARGFVPTKTWSAHWIENEQFRPVLKNFCQREQHGMQHQVDELTTMLPFREAS